MPRSGAEMQNQNYVSMLATAAPPFEFLQGSSVSIGPSRTRGGRVWEGGGSRKGTTERLLCQARKGTWRGGLGEAELKPWLED